MYDMRGIYDHVLKHITEKHREKEYHFIGPPDGFGFSGQHNTTEKIELMDSYESGEKYAHRTAWKFTIKADAISAKFFKKSLKHDEVIAFAESYHRLMNLVESYKTAD